MKRRIIAIAVAAVLITAPVVAILASTSEQTNSDDVSETENSHCTTTEFAPTYEPPLVSNTENVESETSEPLLHI